jgi:hypothetical protein
MENAGNKGNDQDGNECVKHVVFLCVALRERLITYKYIYEEYP